MTGKKPLIEAVKKRVKEMNKACMDDEKGKSESGNI